MQLMHICVYLFIYLFVVYLTMTCTNLAINCQDATYYRHV